jgi:zinc protease
MSVNRMRRWLLLLVLLIAAPAYAVPEIQHWTTPKGGRVYFVPTDGLPLVDVRLVFDAGSVRDGQKFGLAALTSAMLDTGAGTWNADAIAERLDSVGADLGTGISRDFAWLSLRSLTLPDKLSVALDTARQILAHPKFDQSDFDREKNRTLLAIKQRGEAPDELVEIAFFKRLYGDHPYAHPEEGYAETVQALTRNDLVDFHQRLYTLRNAIVVIVGDVKRADAEAIADQLIGELPEGETPPALSAPQPKTAANTERTPFPSEQTHVLSGTLGLKVNDPDYFPLYVGNHILGGSGLVSLVSKEVREKRGLSYSAYSYFFPYRELGPFQIGLQTRNDQADEALRVALKTLEDFVARGPSVEELEAAKQNIVGGFVLRLDSNKKLTEQVAAIAFYNRPLDYLARYTDRIKAVSREDIKRAFRSRIDPGKLQTVLVGGGAK